MKKVHSSVWADLIDDYVAPAPYRSIIRANASVRALGPCIFQGTVLDGPFTESKESCAHVAILARMAAARREVH